MVVAAVCRIALAATALSALQHHGLLIVIMTFGIVIVIIIVVVVVVIIIIFGTSNVALVVVVVVVVVLDKLAVGGGLVVWRRDADLRHDAGQRVADARGAVQPARRRLGRQPLAERAREVVAVAVQQVVRRAQEFFRDLCRNRLFSLFFFDGEREIGEERKEKERGKQGG
jgi:uncharacterized membrane protein YqjE